MSQTSKASKRTLSQILSAEGGFDVDASAPLPAAVQKAIHVARHLQTRGLELQTPQERRQQREFERMMATPEDKTTLIQMTDQAFRSRTARRAADQLIHILDVQGVPRFFGVVERAMLRGFQSFGGYLPGVSVPMVKEKMRAETANVILPAEREVLAKHLEARRRSGVRMNVNYLGEALLGEKDAKRRLKSYLDALQMPEIECISVKISTIYSQITSIAHAHAVSVLSDRMEFLYRAATKARFERADGTKVRKFVYLDMEEYPDLNITLDVFMGTLSRPGLESVNAGIALQAYLPDSYEALRTLQRWALKRVAAGGSPVTVRLVKGANMEAERVVASIHGWPQAPYKEKRETDANYKRMLRAALHPDAIDAVHIGVGSHNLFDLSYALVLAAERGIERGLQIEMLEGMANHQRRALGELAPSLLLYAPSTTRDEFVNAIGYLIRRLDENTGPENFLRHAFKMKVGSDAWCRLEDAFVESVAYADEVSSQPRRTQDRNTTPSWDPDAPLVTLETFANEPDTDFALPANVRWAEAILARWSRRHGEAAAEIPLVIGGFELRGDRDVIERNDPSRPGVVVARHWGATEADIAQAIDCARDDVAGWRTRSSSERGRILARVAHELRVARGELMGAACADAGKHLTESDPEVSEAIDFVEYYAASARAIRAMGTVDAEPRGVVAVITPWNFPIAIPCGGIVASLAAGNTVIFKPAPLTVLVGYELCQCFWRAGVPREALQFAPCRSNKEAAALATSAGVDVVVFTGSTATALAMLDARPEMHLLAETGGKNATIVTAMSDPDQAIKHVVHSAFGHAGQKCSATSLLLLEAELYDDPTFRDRLCDAIRSRRVGSAWDLSTRIGPLIRPPNPDLTRGLLELEDGERWALMTKRIDDNPQLYTPAVKWDVSPGSDTHMTEFFGPVLGVMRFKRLREAIEIVNQTGYGLTSGLESLDDREHEVWRQGIRAGNLYINRPTTGAIVQRQPFGGVGKSAFGPGIKAGGPNYVTQLMRVRDREPIVGVTASPELGPEIEALKQRLLERITRGDTLAPDFGRAIQAISSYALAYETTFSRDHDPVRLLGQDNILRYLPLDDLRIRVHPADTPFEILARICAARIVGCRMTVSVTPSLNSDFITWLDRQTETWGAGIEFVEESIEAFVTVIERHHIDRVRYAAPGRAATEVLRAVGDSGIYIAQAPVLCEGRIELLWYLNEQAISYDYHRYGNLGARAQEPRRPVL